MNTISNAAGSAFDSIADTYDEVFTDSVIGRAQRNCVWRIADRVFHSGSTILELNCGTGIDAIHFAQRGLSVVACDASSRMIEIARRRVSSNGYGRNIATVQLPTEQLRLLSGVRFDGVFSNFSGLNCVSDLHDVADALAELVRPGGRALLCMSSRYCAWEWVWYAVRADFKKASRRWKGYARPAVNGTSVDVSYPTVAEIASTFAPSFHLRRATAIGLLVPPSYVEHAARHFPKIVNALEGLDATLGSIPLLRSLGDHTLLELVRGTV